MQVFANIVNTLPTILGLTACTGAAALWGIMLAYARRGQLKQNPLRDFGLAGLLGFVVALVLIFVPEPRVLFYVIAIVPAFFLGTGAKLLMLPSARR